MRRCVLSSLKKKREKRRVHDFLLSRLIILLTRDSLRAFFRSDVKTDLPVGIDVDDDDRCRWGSFERSFIRVSIIFQ